MSSLQRFFLTDRTLTIDCTINLGMISHQLQVVLRLQPRAQIVLLDSAGRAFLTEIITLDRKAATGRVLIELPQPPEPAIPVTLINVR
jgi:16S rRNA U1498 N3-methylase RsmE